MKSRFRPRAAIVAFAATLITACGDAPTGAVISAADQPAALNTAPTVTVSNSGGYPLISWDALVGATSYTVEYVRDQTRIIKATFETEQVQYVTLLANTTDTSHLDSARPYTGDIQCASYGTFETRITWYRYKVTAHYATGSASKVVPAPVSPC